MALPLTIGRGHHGTLGHHRGPTFSTTDSSAHTLSQTKGWTSPVISREFKLSSEDVGEVNFAECGSVETLEEVSRRSDEPADVAFFHP